MIRWSGELNISVNQADTRKTGLALTTYRFGMHLPPLRLWRHRTTPPIFLLVALALSLAGAISQAFAGFDEGLAAYEAGNFKLAYEEFLTAAERGDAVAQFYLGMMYDKGRGVQRNYTTAARWYRQAAEQGDAVAQFNLALMYATGEGVARDEVVAAQWFRQAAAQGHIRAQFNIGVMYEKGEGISRDDQAAVRWYRKAANQGYTKAQFNLALMYDKGQGVPRNYEEAVRWYRRAADQGHSKAQFNIGVMYDKGQGIPRSYVEAYRWYSLAAAQSNEKAAHNLDLLEKVMTPAQIATAQERARNWRPSSDGGNDKQETEPSNGSPRPVATGSGFLASPAGHVLTNHHVVEECDSVRVSPPETVAVVTASDITNDLALLSIRVDNGIAPVSFRVEPARLGETVVVAGYPLHGLAGQGLNVTQGEVSALSGLRGDSRHLQITAPVQPGNSGGPLLDGAGRVAGVVVGKLNALGVALQTGDIPQNINFAIRSGIVLAFLDAHAVPYRASSDGKAHSVESIAETARSHTMLVECWQ